MTGKFIVLEGIDGSGKSTVSQQLYQEFLNNNSKAVDRNSEAVLLCEPTKNGPYTKEIRNILGSEVSKKEDINITLKDLFLKDRLWNINNQVKPSLKEGKVVIQDRYYYSTAAYQGKNIAEVSEIIQQYRNIPEVINPDLVIFLEIDPEVALKRVSNRNKKIEIFEKIESLKRINQHYDFIWKEFGSFINCVKVNTDGSLPDIIDTIQHHIRVL